MSADVQTFSLEWQGIRITVQFEPDWSRPYREIYGFALALMHVRAENNQPLPITQTGYRSAFLPAPVLEDYDSPAAYLRDWLDAEANTDEWRRACAAARQGSLF